MELVLQNISTGVGLMPIRCVTFHNRIFNGEFYIDSDMTFYNLESESNLRIIPITRDTHWGTIKRLGYKFEATLYVPYNKLNISYDGYDLINVLENIFKGRYTIILDLGTAQHLPDYTPPVAINSTWGMKIKSDYNINHSIEIETVEYRPRIILRIFGFIRKLSDIEFM